MAADPISQFQVTEYIHLGTIAGQDLSFTNSALFMGLAVGSVVAFMAIGSAGRVLVPNRIQSIVEIMYEFVASTVRSTTGDEGMRFFPFVFSIFTFILFCNMLGMFPYFFTVTSHISITFTLAMTVMALVIGFGLRFNGWGFFRIFVPSGVPVYLLPMVVFIEILSFVSRPISLSLRLFANMLAGHIALKVFAGFVISLGSFGVLGGIAALVPLAFTVGFTALELMVSALQAYVFTILTCVYLNDALHPGAH